MTSEQQTTTKPQPKATPSASQPSSPTPNPSTPTRIFYYRFKAKNHQGLLTFCEGEINADGFVSAGNIIFNELHPKVKDAELKLSVTPLESTSKEWTSIDQELPDADVTVLTLDELTDSYALGYFDDDADHFWEENGTKLFSTHWQHLTTPA